MVAPRRVPPELRLRMQRFLVQLADSPAGRAQLDKLGIERYSLPAGVDYAPVRAQSAYVARQGAVF